MKARLPRALSVLGTFAWLGTAAAQVAPRWVAETTDATIDQALVRARAKGEDALAAMALVHALSERASRGHAEAALAEIAKEPGELGATAAWLAALEGGSKPAGLVSELAIWG